MGFLKKLKFWKKKRNVSSGKNETCDATTQTELNRTSDATIQDLSMDLKRTVDVGIQVVSGDNNLTCQGSSQTEGWNERVLKRQLQELKHTLATYECQLRSENRQIERLETEVAVKRGPPVRELEKERSIARVKRKANHQPYRN